MPNTFIGTIWFLKDALLILIIMCQEVTRRDLLFESAQNDGAKNVVSKYEARFLHLLKIKPRTHKICDIKNFWTKFCPNLTILVSLESWRRDLFKFGKTKLRRDPNFVKIEIWG